MAPGQETARAPGPSAARSLALSDEAATLALGARLAGIGSPARVLLQGDLGAGKTTLVRGLLRARGHEGAVKSPTYTIVEPYGTPAGQVFHFDLYRLADAEELDAMGFRDYLDADALCLIEWPERAPELVAAADLRIVIEIDGDGRRATVEARTALGHAWAGGLRESSS